MDTTGFSSLNDNPLARDIRVKTPLYHFRNVSLCFYVSLSLSLSSTLFLSTPALNAKRSNAIEPCWISFDACPSERNFFNFFLLFYSLCIHVSPSFR